MKMGSGHLQEIYLDVDLFTKIMYYQKKNIHYIKN